MASVCNNLSSENLSIFSIFGSTTWAWTKLTVVFPNESGNSLKFSACT
jgi:hypothetical protein